MLPPDDVSAPPSDQGRRSRLICWLLGLLPVILLAALAITAYQLRDEYNPFWESTAEFREAQGLAVTLQHRALTDQEFNRALELCEAGHVQARADAVSVVGESVKRDPARADAAVAVLRRLVRAKHSKPKAAAERVLRQIGGRPGPD